ncbi:hypothetical protein PHYBLDRAFT_149241 [Phycomyces blakesleeanus NRRL 1555(-)]|uniref:Uncharacterized protein n=1 Tax=Phycomyces blakesleeanus (strain ATCC 8743b / DSM 1359 / FGSC 10004 / NBRC 33097 / NRRL 1555) TaxID=763407 RepID=A0A162WPR1_PHYB8|nr:hypothetical protein PHYBLDRAFT_149241 [Phycomyces blakesleeanus NRRL 1555(-)]OAD69455.1 hypothetical protein PHYBLDRAFT_149241 [Phycomyces blakesleeanus NRRL 1555(-)]|eukprot:XP_018287495.1 hypothetical protein PHYBLDRAFT_149241 [Phycomyces blakesleeanus NRRL 1555(-)]
MLCPLDIPGKNEKFQYKDTGKLSSPPMALIKDTAYFHISRLYPLTAKEVSFNSGMPPLGAG